ATPTMSVPLQVSNGLAVEGDAMLKTAILFFVCSVAIAAFAPQLLSYGLKPRVETVTTAAPVTLATSRPVSEESAGFREAVLHSNSHGQYLVDVLIKGETVPMMVDT